MFPRPPAFEYGPMLASAHTGVNRRDPNDDVIYHSQRFEHLSEEEGITFHEDCHRVLDSHSTLVLAARRRPLGCVGRLGNRLGQAAAIA